MLVFSRIVGILKQFPVVFCLHWFTVSNNSTYTFKSKTLILNTPHSHNQIANRSQILPVSRYQRSHSIYHIAYRQYRPYKPVGPPVRDYGSGHSVPHSTATSETCCFVCGLTITNIHTRMKCVEREQKHGGTGPPVDAFVRVVYCVVEKYAVTWMMNRLSCCCAVACWLCSRGALGFV